jgi:hypothetical protein
VRPEDYTLEACWNTFAEAAVPPEAPPEQRFVMRQTFLAALSTILELEAASRSLPLPHQRRMLDRWSAEVESAIKADACSGKAS